MNDQERFAALRERLSRQMRIKELGEDGEKRILKTRFLVIGAGGLGSPALLYLEYRLLPCQCLRLLKG